MTNDAGTTCSKCGASVPSGTDYCRACGASLTAVSTSSSVPSHSSSASGSQTAGGAKPAPTGSLSAFQTGKSKVWVPLILGLAGVAVIVVIIAVATGSSDSADTAASAGEGGAGIPTCSAERLQDLAGDYVDLGNRTQSALEAIPDVLTRAQGARRVRIRFERESAKAQQIASECVDVDGAESGPAVVGAVTRLDAANADLYGYVTPYLSDGIGSESVLDNKFEAAGDAVNQFNTAWESFAAETGFSINDNTSTLDESTETD